MIRTQTLRADKYSLSPGEINVGTRGSYGEEKLRFEFSGEWDGLIKKAVFYPVRGKAVAVLLDGKEDIDVPYEITRMSGQAKLVVSGSLIGDGKNPQKIITVTAILNVRFTQDDKGASAGKVTPDLYDQFLEDAKNTLSDEIKEALASGDYKGDPGVTPHIGSNGNWFIGSTDTGVKARGERGQAGADGRDGVDGTDGKDGTDGITPHIGDNGNWYIGDADTGEASRGEKGADGDPGVFVKETLTDVPSDNDTVMVDMTVDGEEILVPDNLSLNGRTLRLKCGTANVGNAVVLPEGGGSGGGGADGYSPTVEFTNITGGRRMTVTDVNGDHTTDILDGVDGTDGTNGTNGADGTDGRGIVSITRTSGDGSAGDTDTYTVTYTDNTTSTFTVTNGTNGTDGTNGVSPTVTFTDITGGRRMTVTDADGEHTTDILDGTSSVSGGGFFKATITASGTTYTADKTFAEIKAAYEEGKIPYVTMSANGSYNLLILSFLSELNGAYFTACMCNDSGGQIASLRISTSNAVMVYTAKVPIVDTAVSADSENAVQNKVIKAYVDGLIGDVDTAISSINTIIGGAS